MSGAADSDRKVLLIGWDAADWKMIHRLVDEGKMPAMERLIDAGVCGNLATLQPVLSPMLWTSIATGKRPFKHGIHGFTEPDPDTGGIRPITNLSRRTKAIWNILNQEGKRSAVVGWWPSHPAEPIDGVMVSNHYQRAGGKTFEEWEMQPGTVYPPRLENVLKELRFHPSELEAEHLLPFVPRAAEIDQRRDPRLQSIGKIIADCTSIHSAATAIIQNEDWDFMAVYYDAIDHFGHGFMKYHPPRREWIPEKDYDLYKDVVEGGYRYHDMMLEVLLQLAGEDTTVILMSDHGFHPDHLRPHAIPIEPAGPAAEHRQFGVFVAKGPGIKRDDRIYGASLLDVCPTILTLFGLPVGEDMDGKPLLDLFEELPEVEWIPSWDEVEGKAGMHPPDKRLAAEDTQAAVDQLVALGYIEKPKADRQQAVDETVRELRFNLAQSYLDAGRCGEAEEILLELRARSPDEHRFGINLAACYRAIGRIRELRALTGELLNQSEEAAGRARQELARLRSRDSRLKRKIEAGQTCRGISGREGRRSRGLAALASAAPVLSRRAALRRLFRQLRRGPDRRALLGQAHPNRARLVQLQVFADLAENKFTEALLRLEELDADGSPGLHNLRGNVYLRMRHWDRAEASFQAALEIDGESPAASCGLARAALGRRDYREAIAAALSSIGLLFHQPRAHYLLGVACLRLGDATRAAEALEVAVRQNPTYPAAYRMLAEIYTRWLRNPDLASHYREQARIARRRLADFKKGLIPPSVPESDVAGVRSGDPQVLPALEGDCRNLEGVPEEEIVTIVSGLPRSGTSLMMQILEAGGLEVLTDGARGADESNPRGYFEYERAKSLQRYQGWLPEARGKVVKIVAQLLPCLPDADEEGRAFHYRVVFMERDLDEVVTSQRRLLERESREEEGVDQGVDLRKVYRSKLTQVRRFLAERGIPVQAIDFAETIGRPTETARRLARFFGGRWEESGVERVVDPSLYRERMEGSGA